MFGGIGFAQAPAASQAESVQDLVNRLTPEQKQQFDQATKAFNAQRYADALAVYKQMLSQLQGDPVISKFASEAALNTGDTNYPMTILKPLVTANPDDWQAVALLTRACAESGDKTCRDSGMAHMIDLYPRGVTPRGMLHYILERIKVGEDTLVIRTSLEPWGNYKVYDLGQVSKDGKIFLRITLESGDFDQIQFAKEHPKEASEGIRSFSLDAYRETGLNSNGQRTQTHYTYKFFVGRPPYDTVRDEFIEIANGKARPLSSRTNLVVP
ncbi:MAG: tetratricopeptide repeat protein [Acidobacteriaceae bacterium]|nr:tetratricopeptide repeat protein [Acidobacteriaceae bacterium]MBV9780065.1 tetratricopeptide repeat protein [Acidobacteriaceae bacterium]